MKYIYAYKTSDGVRHEESMKASSRDEVFSELRKRGIKAIKVVAADGSKANGEIRGLRKRVVAGLVAFVAIAVGIIAYFTGARTAPASSPSKLTVDSSPRHQIYGDPAVLEAFERGDFGEALERTGDRLLAVFAQPGRFMASKDINPRVLTQEQLDAFSFFAATELRKEFDIAVKNEDPREVQELKRIVNGMRDEMRSYLSNGNGNARSFWRRLNERTLLEAQIYERTRLELEKEKSQAVWEEKNEALRRLGIRTIPYPNE